MPTTRFRWLVRAAILLLLVTVLTIGVIASGLLDQAPVGRLRWQLADRQIRLPSESREILWLEEVVPDSAITIRATAALNMGEKDSGYGLAIGNEEAYLAVAVSPLGYLSIWESDVRSENDEDSYLLPWQTWPHVRTDNSPNEIWVDVKGNRAAVRVNREWLWEGEVSSSSGNIGLLGESFAKSAVIDFESVELFAERDR